MSTIPNQTEPKSEYPKIENPNLSVGGYPNIPNSVGGYPTQPPAQSVEKEINQEQATDFLDPNKLNMEDGKNISKQWTATTRKHKYQ